MMQEARWNAEAAIMKSHFPGFVAFKTESGKVGFLGFLRGPHSGNTTPSP
jgi:hypothetical protein